MERKQALNSNPCSLEKNGIMFSDTLRKILTRICHLLDYCLGSFFHFIREFAMSVSLVFLLGWSKFHKKEFSNLLPGGREGGDNLIARILWASL